MSLQHQYFLLFQILQNEPFLDAGSNNILGR